MANRPRKETEELFDIYLILSQISNEFYVWRAANGNGYNAYKEHVRSRKTETQDLFQRSLDAGKAPKMYLLETVKTTKRGSYRHIIAWTKYFIERGFQSVSYSKTQDYAADISGETIAIYDEIKDKSTAEIICEERLIVKDYKRKTKSDAVVSSNRIKIYVSKKDYLKIEKQAKRCNMPVVKYCKKRVMEGKTIYVDSPIPLLEHLRTIRDAKVILRQIRYNIERTGKYYPADIENIEKMSQKIIEDASKLASEIDQSTQELLEKYHR